MNRDDLRSISNGRSRRDAHVARARAALLAIVSVSSLLLATTGADAQSPVIPLLFAESSMSDLTPAARLYVERSYEGRAMYGRSVRINKVIFDNAKPGDRIVLNLFVGVSFEAICAEGGSPYPGLRQWLGSVPGDTRSRVSLTFSDEDGMLTGDVDVGGRYFRIEATDKSGWHSVVELRRLPALGPPQDAQK